MAEAIKDPLPDYLEETIAGSMAILREALLPAPFTMSAKGLARRSGAVECWKAA